MINLKFINATSVQLIDSTTSTAALTSKIEYTIGESQGSPVFTCNLDTFSKDPANYYYFEITGSNVQLSGTIGNVTEAYQYWNLFKGQTAITDASNLTLSSTTVKKFSYANMFMNCSNLTSPPTISATTLDQWCYSSMFAGCRSLTSAPTLVATTLAPNCYFAMFYGCKSLSSAPVLPAQTLTDWCYGSMFFNCSNLTSISSDFSTWSPSSATKYWVTGIDTKGKFYDDAISQSFGNDAIPKNWKKDYSNIPLTFKATSNDSEILLEEYDRYGLLNPITLQYSKNGGTWTNYTVGDTISLNQNETVAFSGANNYFSKDANDYYFFTMNGDGFEVSGNVMSLMNFKMDCTSYCFNHLFKKDNLLNAPLLPATGLANGCYQEMFQLCQSLTGVTELPATTLAQACYLDMFHGCSSLTLAPQLPATTLADSCYAGMFQNCTSLTAAPVLPAKPLANYCYQGMFKGCTSLSTPPVLPAKTLGRYCYHDMFGNCTSLTAAPTLPATRMAVNSYYFMFEGCTALSTPPELPASSLEIACYAGMFSGCTALTSIPILSANLQRQVYQGMFAGCTSLSSVSLPGNSLSIRSHQYMFKGCSNLSNVDVAFTDWNDNLSATTDWVSGVAANGTFTKPAALPLSTGINYIPEGWTVVDKT